MKNKDHKTTIKGKLSGTEVLPFYKVFGCTLLSSAIEGLSQSIKESNESEDIDELHEIDGKHGVDQALGIADGCL